MFIYLASPYAHPDPAVMQERFHQASYTVAHFLRKNITVYSPIAHNHYLACNFDLPRTWGFWQGPDLDMLFEAEELWILQLPGWEESTGVRAEREQARGGKPVLLISWENICGEDYQYGEP